MGNYKNTGNYKPSASSGWTLGTELSSTPETDDQETNFQNTLYRGNIITLPTTEKYYVISAIECKHGATLNGSVAMCVGTIDAEPPVSTGIVILAHTDSVACANASAVQKVPVEGSQWIRGGMKICGFVHGDGATNTFRLIATGSINNYKAVNFNTVTPLAFNDTAWTATTNGRAYCKIYYKPVEGV